MLDSIPRGRDLQNVFTMAPGVTQAVADVGGSTMAQRQNLSSYGVLSQPKLQVEGMNITMGADQNTAIYFNDSTLEEVQIKTSGNDAEVSVPGISMVAIMKSGGNAFHGTYQISAESPTLQADNLNDALRAQGLTATSPLKNFYDLSADLGGRIIRDKFWFYGAYGRQAKNEGLLGFASSPGPDGKYLTADDPLANVETSLSQMSAKLSYQLTKNNRLVYAWQRGTKAQPQNNAGRFTPLESTRDYLNPTAIQKIELQSMISPQVLVNAVAGYSGYVTDYDAARSYARADAPPRQDLATTLNTGSAPLHQNKTRDRYQTDDSISFFPQRSFAGKHELKTGISIYLDKSSDGYLNNLACNCILYTDTIGGVPNTPSQIRIYNTPVVPEDHDNTYAVVPERQLAAVGHGDGQPRRPLGAPALVPPCTVVRRRARLADRVPGRVVPANRRADAHACGAAHWASPGISAVPASSRRRSACTTTCWATPTPTPSTGMRPRTPSSPGTI